MHQNRQADVTLILSHRGTHTGRSQKSEFSLMPHWEVGCPHLSATGETGKLLRKLVGCGVGTRTRMLCEVGGPTWEHCESSHVPPTWTQLQPLLGAGKLEEQSCLTPQIIPLIEFPKFSGTWAAQNKDSLPNSMNCTEVLCCSQFGGRRVHVLLKKKSYPFFPSSVCMSRVGLTEELSTSLTHKTWMHSQTEKFVPRPHQAATVSELTSWTGHV